MFGSFSIGMVTNHLAKHANGNVALGAEKLDQFFWMMTTMTKHIGAL
jgi:hypothetical protein